jgi:dTDP-4-amino-4,6-dideoxygalactose transaminase
MTSLSNLAAELEVPLLVDSAESMGATFDGRAAGSFGDVSITSFNGNKIMTTSGGGMLLTNDGRLADRVRYLSTQARQPERHYEHTEVGYNYRLSNVLAALGRGQLARLDEMMLRRRALRSTYQDLFADVAGVTVFGAPDANDNCWLTSIVIEGDKSGWTAEQLRRHLDERDIESRPMWKPMHRQPAFAGQKCIVNGNADWLFEHGLTLPSGSAMSATDIDRIVTAIRSFLGSL